MAKNPKNEFEFSIEEGMSLDDALISTMKGVEEVLRLIAEKYGNKSAGIAAIEAYGRFSQIAGQYLKTNPHNVDVTRLVEQHKENVRNSSTSSTRG